MLGYHNWRVGAGLWLALTLACGRGGQAPAPMPGQPRAQDQAEAQGLDFAVGFFNKDRQKVVHTSLSLVPGVPVNLQFMAFWLSGVNPALGPVSMTLEDLPPFLSAGFDGGAPQGRADLNELHSLELQAQPGLAAGLHGFRIKASFMGLTRTLPVLVNCCASSFDLQPLATGTVAVAQGQTLFLSLPLRRGGAYYVDQGGADPSYLGEPLLAVAGSLPPGLVVTFPERDCTGLAAVPVAISAGAALAPGSYTVNLQATRSGVAEVPPAPHALTVRVTESGARAIVWLQQVDWGQTVVAPDLPLVGGKPALLRVRLLADRHGVPAPALRATLRDAQGLELATLPLRGPAWVPLICEEGDFPDLTGAAGASYTALLPAAAVRPGLQLSLEANAQPLRVWSPAVVPGRKLELTLVPVVHRGVAPVLPPDAVIAQELTALWPIQGVTLRHRAPYVSNTLLPQPGDPGHGAAWSRLLSELSGLRILDGASSNYYGFLNPGISSSFTWSITGISLLGDGVGLGIDTRAAAQFQNADGPRDLATRVMAHELGHAFNLNHTPGGGAGEPQLNYPYAGAALGTWGYEPLTGVAHAATRERDLMSYARGAHWISDWNYRNAMAFLEQNQGQAPQLAPAEQSEQWLVSGRVDPAGQVELLPLVRTRCAPAPPVPGPCQLRLTTGGGTQTIAFSAAQGSDLPAGHRPFAFTVPAGAELLSAELKAPGHRSCRRKAARSQGLREAALDAPQRGREPVLREADSALRLEWDPMVHPYLNVFHEGERRTTLAMHLTGGSATLATAGLPVGGRFLIHYSDGLNPVIRSWARSE